MTLSRQRVYQIRHAAKGLCHLCSRPVWRQNVCFRCYVRRHFGKHGIIHRAKRSPKTLDTLIVGMAARFERILHDEGFSVDAVKEPAKMIEASGIQAKGKYKKKILAVIARMDDLAIRERFGGGDDVSERD